MKKIIPWLVCLATMLCILPTAAAEESLKEDIFTYSVSGKNAIVTNVDDTQKVVEVPKTLGGYTVTAIGDGAFGGSTVIEEVVLPDSVTTIGSLCFAYSNSLQKVTFPKKLTTVSNGAFYHCEGLWTVALPEGVKNIGDNAFGRCTNLTAVTLPETVTSIGENAFPDSKALRLYSKMDSAAYTYAQEKGIGFEEYITVTVNGKEIIFDQPCITDTENYRTMVPMRAVLEELGAEITWDNTFNTAGINVLGTRLLIRPGEPFMMVNGVVRYLNCPAIEFNGRVMVPIRDVMESIGGKVVWNEAQKLVTVTCAVPETETETTTR